MLSRRQFLVASAGIALSRRSLFADSAPPVVTVYKDPGCECCVRWVKHLSANGFVVTARDTAKMDDIKRTMGVPSALQSCHTAVVGRYVVEGHVPADVIKKFMSEKSTSLGLAVPGMVTGSPGMEGEHPEHYDVVVFERDGKSRIYAKR
jgi:hypothetical protein